jgi:G patch domain and KOW motifs-containing protein
VARLPDEADEAAYEAMPIEEFGAAMLRGMGWSEGQVLAG